MKLASDKLLRHLTGTDNPDEQVAVLRRRNLYPFVCPRTGRPVISERVVEQSMVEPPKERFTGNMEAFE